MLLYDRTFGGIYSLFQRHNYKRHGPGVVVAHLSHPPRVFGMSKKQAEAENISRVVRLEYIHSEGDLLELAHEVDSNFPDAHGDLGPLGGLIAVQITATSFIYLINSRSECRKTGIGAASR